MNDVRVGDYVFRCEDGIEVARAKTLFTKEPGTIAWLQRQVTPDDVLWDIGANIGLYTVVAAKLGATVVAVEPSPANAAALLRNIQANALERVIVLTVALHDADTWLPFHLISLRGGASGHQLGEGQGAVVREQKIARRADTLVAERVIPPPTLVKIDVDGHEPAILRGMWNTLTRTPPRSLQVEVQPETRKVIPDLLEPMGYTFRERHDTMAGALRLKDGAAPAGVAHNAIWER